jgi:hypothetical protein
MYAMAVAAPKIAMLKLHRRLLGCSLILPSHVGQEDACT